MTPQFQWQLAREKNPFYYARLTLHKSQKELAEILGVSEQYIYRHENGLVNTPSKEYCDWLNEQLGTSDDYFQDVYESWILEMREYVSVAVGSSSLHLLNGPRSDVNHLRDEHPFKTFIFNITELCARKFGFLYNDPQFNVASVQLFNRLVCLHPRSVQQYTAPGASADIPPLLRQALSESGIDEPTLNELKRQVALYSLRKVPL